MSQLFETFIQEEKGIALVVAIIVIFVLSSLCLTLLSLTTTHARLSRSYRDEAQALCLAESGLEEAIWRLNGGELFKTSPEHLIIIGSDTIGSYQYWIKSGAEDTLYAEGYVPNKKNMRLRKQMIKIIHISSDAGNYRKHH